MPQSAPFASLDAEFRTEATSLPVSASPSMPMEIDVGEDVKSEDGGIDNKEFIVTELKTVIQTAGGVMQNLENECRIGAQPRTFEVYAKMMDSMANAITKLAEVEALDIKMKNARKKMESNSGGLTRNVQNNFVFEGTSSDMLKALKEARKLAGKTP